MDIGVAIGDVRGPASASDLLDQAHQVRDAGLGMVWVTQAMGWDSLIALATVGGNVPGLRLGASVVPVPQRHPLVLASQALSTQAATGNRLTLGIGAGVSTFTNRLFGITYDRPARRIREYLGVLNPLLRGETVDHNGETITAVNPAARVVAGLLVSVTDDETAVRQRISEQFAIAGQVPEYQAVLAREGARGPGDVVVVGDEGSVTKQLDRIRDAGVTDFLAVPYGSPAEQVRTMTVLGG